MTTCCAALGLVAALLALPARAESPTQVLSIDVRQFSVVKRDSGPVNYFSIVQEGGESFLRADYKPPMKTVVMGYQFPDQFHKGTHLLRWKWRARVLPLGGNECDSKKPDSAAVVYVTWKGPAKWYTLKYVWSSVGPKGAVCDKKNNPFFAQQTVILESGGPLHTWVTEQIDPAAEFRKYFRKGDPKASVPDLRGMGIMSDGDQTKSESSADYGGFFISD